MMLWFNLKSLLSRPYGFYDYIWIDCTLVKETQKAILIMFDGRRIWIPRAWISVIASSRKTPTWQLQKPISIKISLYNWSKKA